MGYQHSREPIWCAIWRHIGANWKLPIASACPPVVTTFTIDCKHLRCVQSNLDNSFGFEIVYLFSSDNAAIYFVKTKAQSGSRYVFWNKWNLKIWHVLFHSAEHFAASHSLVALRPEFISRPYWNAKPGLGRLLVSLGGLLGQIPPSPSQWLYFL